MEGRMKEHQLTKEEIDLLLQESKMGHLGTQNEDGFPYVTPVHFAYTGDCIYIHGLNRGQKLANIKANDKICFETADMEGLILDDKACDVNTKYKSVIIFGTAAMVEEKEEKIEALNKVVGKYTPHLLGQEYPENMLKGTGVIKIIIKTVTGKYYK